jgi:hypothetical protein
MVPTARSAAVSFVLAMAALPLAFSKIAGDVSPAVSASTRAVPSRSFGLTGFVENRGQWEEGIRFFARAGASEVIVTAEGFWLVPNLGHEPERVESAPDPLFFRLGKAATIEGVAEVATKHHFHFARGSTSHVPGFESVQFREVRAGIDVVLRRDGEWFAYDVIAEAGADLASFAVVVEGARHAAMVGDDIALDAGAHRVLHRIGDVWQESANSTRESLSATARVVPHPAGAALQFDVPSWSGDRRVVIDPTLMYLTYIGTPANDSPRSMDVDSTGAVIVFGQASGGPTTPNTLQPTPPSGLPMWIGKLAPGGGALEWATYLGGSATQTQMVVRVGPDDAITLAGRVWSVDFPVTPGAFQTQHAGLSDAYVTRITPDGSALIWSTFLGGSGQDGVGGGSQPAAPLMAIAPNGDVVVAMTVTSEDFHATPGAYDTTKDGHDKIIARIAADGSSLVFATWLPVGLFEAIAIDESGDIYYTGRAAPSLPAPTTPGAWQESVPGTLLVGAIGKLTGDGSTLVWGTYLGGTGSDLAHGIAVDRGGAVYVCGHTSSLDFPVTPGALKPTKGGSASTGGGFVTKLTADGRRLAWSTYLNGCCNGTGSPIAAVVDRAGNVTVVGSTNQGNWPTTPDAFQPNFIGPAPKSDVVLTKLDALGRAAVYSTYIAGNGSESSERLAVDAQGRAYVAMETYSLNLPVTPGAYQSQHAGGTDIAVAAFDLGLLPWHVHGGQSKSGPHVPNLAGVGTLAPGSPTTLAIRGGAPHGPGWLVVGLHLIDLPLPEFACVLHPLPELVVPLTLDGIGALDIAFPWFQGGAQELHLQLFGFHPEAPGFLYASNGLSTGF